MTRREKDDFETSYEYQVKACLGETRKRRLQDVFVKLVWNQLKLLLVRRNTTISGASKLKQKGWSHLRRYRGSKYLCTKNEVHSIKGKKFIFFFFIFHLHFLKFLKFFFLEDIVLRNIFSKYQVSSNWSIGWEMASKTIIRTHLKRMDFR